MQKYYVESQSLPKSKLKWFRRNIYDFDTWKATDMRRWLHILKMIIRENENRLVHKDEKITIKF